MSRRQGVRTDYPDCKKVAEIAGSEPAMELPKPPVRSNQATKHGIHPGNSYLTFNQGGESMLNVPA